MAIVKVVELIGESAVSWEDAAKTCIEDASATIRNIKSVWIKDFQIDCEDPAAVKFRVNCKVSFLIDETRRHV